MSLNLNNTFEWRNHKLNSLCLGTAQFGQKYGISNPDVTIPIEKIHSILDYYLKHNNLIDTAKNYGNCEEIIGDYIQKKKTHSLKVFSKDKLENINRKYVQETLKLLNIKNLFCIFLHNPNDLNEFSIKKKMEVKKCKKLNLFNYLGASIYNDEQFNQALNNSEIDIIQIPFNLFDQRAIKLKWLQKAKQKNKLILIRSIYLQGLLLMDINKIPKHLEHAKKHIKLCDNLCEKFNIKRIDLCTSFINQNTKNNIILFGCYSLNQLKETLDSINNKSLLSKENLKEIITHFSNIEESIYNPIRWQEK